MDFIKAIPTEYKGIRFKSRMEAQCALLLDRAGFEWTYETESVMLPNGHAYLLDFEVCDKGGDRKGGDRKYAIECRGYHSPKGHAQVNAFVDMFGDRGFLHYIVIGPDEPVLYDGSDVCYRPALKFCDDCNCYQFGVPFDPCGECGATTRDVPIHLRSGKILVDWKASDEWDFPCAG